MTDLQKEALILMGADPDDLAGAIQSEILQRIAELAGRMEDYLKQKYPDTTFTVRGVKPRSVLVRYDEFTIAPADEPDSDYSVQIWSLDGTYAMTDNYYGALVQGDYEAHLRGLLADEGIEATVLSTIDCQLGERFGASMPLNEALAEDGFLAYAWVLLPPGAADAEGCAQAVEALVTSQRLWGSFTVYALSSPLPENAGREDILDVIAASTAEAPAYTYEYSFTNFDF